MDALNALLQWAEYYDPTGMFYQAFHILAFLGAFIFNLWYAKKYDMTWKDGLLITVIIWPVAYLFLYVLGWIETGFTQWGDISNVVKGMIFFPLIILPAALLLRRSPAMVMDYFAPCLPLSQAISRIGCMFSGCCGGFPAYWGIYSPRFGLNVVPTQIFESIAAIAVFLFCIGYAKKHHYNSNGRVYPLMMITFGVTRFFLEFLRFDKDFYSGDIGYSIAGIFAAIMAIVGAVWLLILIRREKGLSISENSN